ncbi:MAG: hypothetical protein E7D79_09915 [Clostridium perfringens]|uniref:Uncharacterized protein n=1 Tax=Clostridium perfringens TaxID=1502 RepID=A0AAW4ISN5_CLOPF|nr:hypothetical protein [Clostridium perfringens]EHP50482.1 hypothetical protein HMPREF9476_00434 [Clostridium perfringens WAL-14572]ELC8417741.1 hypothetical protein [Clostridium perfringens]MBO3354321.1 hypothetical protein [Clostridium perfringens]MBO3357591.1 hypothetical protein [Clostridium perfringens]MCX0367939.1 hypothetical protein [Clostridium perfringens]
MDVRIYKINTGITGRNFSSDKRSNFPIGGKTNSFYSIGNLMRGIEDFYLEGNLYFIDKEEELEKFYNPFGDRWVAKKKYYISHPKKERENYLLEASKFHEYIVREQLEEIANYLHYELNINSLKIEVEEGNDFSSYTNIVLEEMNLNDDGKVELKEDKTLEIKWSGNDTRDYEANQGMKDANGLNKERDSNPFEESGEKSFLEESGEKSFKEDKARNILESGILNGKNEFLWIEDFEGLINKVQELKASNKRGEKESLEGNSLGKGEASYILEIDNSFGISEKIGKKIGVNPTWLKKCSFKITF